MLADHFRNYMYEYMMYMYGKNVLLVLIVLVKRFTDTYTGKTVLMVLVQEGRSICQP